MVETRMSTKVWGRQAGLMAVAALAVGIATAPRAHAFSDQDEVKVGRIMAPRVERAFGGVLPASSPLSVRVQRIGLALSKLAGRKGVPLSYKVLNNDRIPNALASPGGHIYITKKLLSLIDNDAQLAYVLGHETGHVELRHTAQMIEEKQRLDGLIGAAGGGITDPAMTRVIADAAYFPVALSFSQQHEIEADLSGARWMSRLGYDPMEAVKILEKVRKLYGGHDDIWSQYFSTHPAPEVREQAILDEIRAENLETVAQAARAATGHGVVPGRQVRSTTAADEPTVIAPATSGQPAPPVSVKQPAVVVMD